MFKGKKKIIVLTLLIVIIAGGAAYGGFRLGAAKKSIVITDSRQILDVDFSLFWEALDVLKNKHIDIGEVKDQDFLYGAIQGAIGALKDPYSTFFNPSDAKKFEEDLTGSFGGIGAEIGIRDNQLLIIAPLKGNPAEAAGLKAGDKILKVNDTVTAGLAVEEAVKLIRGDPDTEVRLLIFRDGWKDAKEFKIARKVIIVPTLDWSMKEGNIAYIQLYNFNANAPSLFYQAALEALIKRTNGIVFDLRNNPGGFLEIAIDIAGWFVEPGDVVVKEKFRSGEERQLRSPGNAALSKKPVVVLINGGSASGAEIVAGALRDNRGIKLIGEKSFGKGSVQEVESLKDGSKLKVSIAEWLTPKGTEINKKGLEPDIEVKITDEDIKNSKDPQLEKAIEILRAEIKSSL